MENIAMIAIIKISFLKKKNKKVNINKKKNKNYFTSEFHKEIG